MLAALPALATRQEKAMSRFRQSEVRARGCAIFAVSAMAPWSGAMAGASAATSAGYG